MNFVNYIEISICIYNLWHHQIQLQNFPWPNPRMCGKFVNLKYSTGKMQLFHWFQMFCVQFLQIWFIWFNEILTLTETKKRCCFFAIFNYTIHGTSFRAWNIIHLMTTTRRESTFCERIIHRQWTMCCFSIFGWNICFINSSKKSNLRCKNKLITRNWVI